MPITNKPLMDGTSNYRPSTNRETRNYAPTYDPHGLYSPNKQTYGGSKSIPAVQNKRPVVNNPLPQQVTYDPSVALRQQQLAQQQAAAALAAQQAAQAQAAYQAQMDAMQQAWIDQQQQLAQQQQEEQAGKYDPKNLTMMGMGEPHSTGYTYGDRYANLMGMGQYQIPEKYGGTTTIDPNNPFGYPQDALNVMNQERRSLYNPFGIPQDALNVMNPGRTKINFEGDWFAQEPQYPGYPGEGEGEGTEVAYPNYNYSYPEQAQRWYMNMLQWRVD